VLIAGEMEVKFIVAYKRRKLKLRALRCVICPEMFCDEKREI